LLEWLLRAVAGDPADLQIMYGLDGARRLPEYELGWLRGYEGSAPVRVGNAAADQLQLHVWGEVLDGLSLTRKALLHQEDDSWHIQTALMEHVEGAWQKPDNGLWEMRGRRQHFTYSKVMAWVAADRMIDAVESTRLTGPVTRWRSLRQQIRAEVLQQGYDAERNTFVQAYGSRDVDASLLLLGRVGFLPHDDRRILGTIEAVQRRLTEGGFVLRYRKDQGDDGLPTGEGVFLACSFWLVDALHAGGRTRQATDLFELLLPVRNDVGLLSEEWDPAAGRQLGNTPQAFSHFPLVMSALQLTSGHVHRSDSPTWPLTRCGSPACRGGADSVQDAQEVGACGADQVPVNVVSVGSREHCLHEVGRTAAEPAAPAALGDLAAVGQCLPDGDGELCVAGDQSPVQRCGVDPDRDPGGLERAHRPGDDLHVCPGI
jgi:GH15 family glucan-1,4-alpha-glucosidase